jgi:hypothetical protein
MPYRMNMCPDVIVQDGIAMAAGSTLIVPAPCVDAMPKGPEPM